MIRTSHLGLFILCLSLPLTGNAQSFDTQRGMEAIYQRGLELSSNLNVMMISLQPGFEDLPALAYYRLGKGARVVSAYVTNGEAGNSDIRYEYPNYLAARRRSEAYEALRILGTDHNFLALVDITTVQDSTRLEELWPADTLRMKLARLISGFKPDLIMLCADPELGNSSLRRRWLKRVLIEAVQELAPPGKSDTLRLGLPQFPYWRVGRVVSDEGEPRGLKIPVGNRHPRTNRTYNEMGTEAAGKYSSLRMQRESWDLKSARSYTVIFPKKASSITSMDQGLPPKLPQKYEALGSRIKTLAQAAQKNPKSERFPKAERLAMLKNVASLIGEVDVALFRDPQIDAAERKSLLDWKGDLESLRAALLGVFVDYSISDKVLTSVQLTYLSIDSVSGLSRSGTTEVLFPAVDDGWIVNEWTDKRLPLGVGSPYRLISPKTVTYNYPDHQFGLQNASLENPFYFFLIHRSAGRESSFVYRSMVDIKFAPRFNVDVVTPIVYAVDSEIVPVRVTNNSRDGVVDQYGVEEPFVTSNKVSFRLSNKGDSHLDSLRLTWNEWPEEGSHVIPIKIKDEAIAGFVARRFEVLADRTKKAGLITAYHNGPTEETLRRLGIMRRRIKLDHTLESTINDLEVLIVDHRFLTFQQISKTWKNAIEERVRKGTHLIILTQDAKAWNSSPLIDGMSLARVEDHDELTGVVVDGEHPFMLSPNKISEDDWYSWIFERTVNDVDIGSGRENFDMIAQTTSGHRYIISRSYGSGRMTYVNLSLHHQLINIHAGAMRILVNLISN